MTRTTMAPTYSGSRMAGSLSAPRAPVTYHAAAPVTLDELVRRVAACTPWTAATVRAYVKPSHEKSLVRKFRQLLAALTRVGGTALALRLHEEAGLGLVDPTTECLDRLDPLEQELDGRENEAQLLRRLAHLPTAAPGCPPSEQITAWRTERRLRLRLIEVNRRMVARGDHLFLEGAC